MAENGTRHHPDTVAPEAPPSPAEGLSGTEPEGFLAAWLDGVAEDLPGADLVVLFAADGKDGGLAPVAIWPDPALPAQAVEPVARRVITTRAGAEARDAEGRVMLGVPVTTGDKLSALVAVRFAAGSPAPGPRVRQRLIWSTGWIEGRLWQRHAEEQATRHAHGMAALDLIAQVGGERRLLPAAQALVTALAAETGVARAALGLVRGFARPGAAVRVEAISGAAWFRRRGAAVVELGQAMEEALDQMGTVAHPAPPDSPRRVVAAHIAALKELGGAAILSTVMFSDGRPVGTLTLTLTDAAALSPALIARLEAAADLLGPVLELKRRQQGWIAGRVVDAAERGLRALGAANRPSYRLATVAIVGALALPFLIYRPLQVTADATLEGAVQRVAVAPFSGRIATATARAGDRVAAGDLLFALDDRDLQLEVIRWRSERDQLLQSSRTALARGNQAEVRQLAAQADQADAQLALAEAQLARAQVLAPIDGIVIAGDLSQRLGAPVEPGAELFTIAPLDAFRLVLDIDERDLDLVTAGSLGTMRLKARAGVDIPLAVTSLTSVARVEEGRRLFRAEAQPLDTPEDLRPGLEGVARIEAGRHSLAFIWTRRLRGWASLAIWQWWP